MWKWLLPVALVLALSSEASALMKAGPGVVKRGLNVGMGPASTLPPMPSDAVPMTMFWGLRPYSAAQATGTTNALRVRRQSDNFEYDIKILPSGLLDVAPGSGPADHCNATSCFVSIVYDQVGGNACSGASCDWVQASAALQPSFVFNCLGTRPCISSNTGTIQLGSANNFAPATGAMSLHYVGNRSVGTAATTALTAGAGGSRIVALAAAPTWQLASATLPTSRAAADAAWHVAAGVVAGASSSLSIDGGTTAGTTTAFTTPVAPFGFRGAAATTQLSMEGGIIDNAILSPAQIGALNTGARAAYGLP